MHCGNFPLKLFIESLDKDQTVNSPVQQESSFQSNSYLCDVFVENMYEVIRKTRLKMKQQSSGQFSNTKLSSILSTPLLDFNCNSEEFPVWG